MIPRGVAWSMKGLFTRSDFGFLFAKVKTLSYLLIFILFSVVRTYYLFGQFLNVPLFYVGIEDKFRLEANNSRA